MRGSIWPFQFGSPRDIKLTEAKTTKHQTIQKRTEPAVQSAEGGMGSPVDKLSDRELEVLELLGRGLGTKGIASELHLSVKTIETHRAHIKDKLGFKDASEMVRFASRLGCAGKRMINQRDQFFVR